MKARSIGVVAAVLALLVVACATGTDASDDGTGDDTVKTDGGKVTDADYGQTLADGAYVPPADAGPAHGGTDAGPKDAGKPTPIDSGTTTPPPPADDSCGSSSSLYDFEWFLSSTSCTVGDGDCDPGDCCYDQGAGDGNPYCISP